MILFIDACVRTDSRTRKLAAALLDRLGEYKTLKLADEELPVLDEKTLEQRTEDCRNGNFDAPYYKYAKQFAEADEIVIAAPYWDLSFPAILKQYIENICVSGITFKYSEEGIPIGLCRAKCLHYVTTSGGPIFNKDFGFGYIQNLAQGMYGISDCRFYSAENLDIIGNDVDAIMEAAVEDINKRV